VRWVDGIGEEWRRGRDGVEGRLVDAVRGTEGASGLFAGSGDDDLSGLRCRGLRRGILSLLEGCWRRQRS
jgi:hypothetical protein